MTLTVKVLLIAALMLSIIIPFGYFLIGEKNKKRYKRSLAVNVFFFFGAFLVAGIMLFAGVPVQAAETAGAAFAASVFALLPAIWVFLAGHEFLEQGIQAYCGNV